MSTMENNSNISTAVESVAVSQIESTTQIPQIDDEIKSEVREILYLHEHKPHGTWAFGHASERRKKESEYNNSLEFMVGDVLVEIDQRLSCSCHYNRYSLAIYTTKNGIRQKRTKAYLAKIC